MKKMLFLFISFLFFSGSYSQEFSGDTSRLIYLNGFKWKQGDNKLSSVQFRKEIYKTPNCRQNVFIAHRLSTIQRADKIIVLYKAR